MLHTFCTSTHPIIYHMHLNFDFVHCHFISAQQTHHIVIFSSLRPHLTCLWKSWIRLTSFDNVRFHNFHLFLLKANLKSSQRFLYTFSVHASMFHYTEEKQQLVLQYHYSNWSTTKRFWAWNYVWASRPSLRASLIYICCCTILKLDRSIVGSHCRHDAAFLSSIA